MKILLVLFLALLLTGCEEPIVLDEELRPEVTTIALQRAAQTDSADYHVIFQDTKLYVLNDEYEVIAIGHANLAKKALFSILITAALFFMIGYSAGKGL